MNPPTSDFLKIYGEVYRKVKGVPYFPLSSDRRAALEMGKSYDGDVDLLKSAFESFLRDEELNDPRLEVEGYSFTLFSFFANRYFEQAHDVSLIKNIKPTVSNKLDKLIEQMMKQGACSLSDDEILKIAKGIIEKECVLPQSEISRVLMSLINRKKQIDDFTAVDSKNFDEPIKHLRQLINIQNTL